VPWILPLLGPPEGRRLVEPFVGSAAVFLASGFRRALLADINPDLVALHAAVRDDPEGLLRAAARHFRAADAQTPEGFLRRRARFNALPPGLARTALFLYLNRHGYNGLCRYNQAGAYTTPPGRFERILFPDALVRVCAERMRQGRVVLRTQSFDRTFAQARRGDVLYADPPYLPRSSSAEFRRYAQAPFGQEAQERLALLCRAAARRGVRVVLSNHDLPEAHRLYAHADALVRIQAPRSIAAGAERAAAELLAVWEAR
jgi:DNA adenine methylase